MITELRTARRSAEQSEMSDDSTPDLANSEPRPPRILRVLSLLGWVAAVLVIVRVVCLFRPLAGPWGFEIASETTYVTQPRLPDGFVDFAGAINARAGEGVTPENNAVVLLIQAVGPAEIPSEHRTRYFELLGVAPLPEDGDYLLDELAFLQRQGIAGLELGDRRNALWDALTAASEQPWHAEEHPEIAELLKINSGPLQLITHASRRKHYYSPIPAAGAELVNLRGPFDSKVRWACNLLRARAHRRLAVGDVARAWDDALTCHRLSRLQNRARDVIGVSYSYGYHGIACEITSAIVRSDALTKDQAQLCLMDLDALGPLPTAVEAVNFADRLTTLDTQTRWALGGRGGGAVRTKWSVTRVLDWNVILQQTNAYYDRAADIMRLDDARERAVRFAAFEAELDPQGNAWWNGATAVVGATEGVNRSWGRYLLAFLATSPSFVRDSQMLAEARLEVTQTGLALAAYEREHARYPDALDEMVPDFFEDVPLDPCGEQDFIYQPSDDGYVLYSVGRNLTDDNGHEREDDPHGDDIVLRVPGRDIADDAPHIDD